MMLMASIVAASAMPAFAKNIKGPDGGRPDVTGSLKGPIGDTVVYHNDPACEPSVQVLNKNGLHGCGSGGGAW